MMQGCSLRCLPEQVGHVPGVEAALVGFAERAEALLELGQRVSAVRFRPERGLQR